MTPFRDRPIKWDGDAKNGRYKELHGFKFDVVTQNVVRNQEEIPRCFLAETQQEAELLYEKFAKVINDIAYAYSVRSGLDRGDLFCEALIGLARAYRDWDSTRSDDFKTYAIFRIRAALDEIIREYSKIVKMPSYIIKGLRNLNTVKQICEEFNLEPWRKYVLKQQVPMKLNKESAMNFTEAVRNLLAAAKRAKVPFERFIERIELVPEIEEIKETFSTEDAKRAEERMEACLLVEKLKPIMNEIEQRICNGIMEGKSQSEIARELDKSPAWVTDKLKRLRTKVYKIIVER